MARTDTLGNFLTDVADAIREKKGTTDNIKASDFDTEIQNLPSGGGAKLFTGHYDTEGLKQIGWTDEEIQYYQDYGVQWNEENDDDFKLTPTELAGNDSNTTRFLPKNSTKKSFSKYYSLLAIPLINISTNTSANSMFGDCYSLTTIPLIDTSNCTNLGNLFSGCYSLTTIPLIDTSKATNCTQMFNNCRSLQTIPLIDTNKNTIFSNFFSSCYSLKIVPQLDTSSATNLSGMFNSCSSLKTIPQLDVSNCINVSNMFYGCYSLMNFGGLKNIGKAYLTTVSANYNNYTITLNTSNALTHDSLMNVINNLYDIKSAGVQSQKLQLGTTNLAKLTADEIAIATNKGWTVS